jgi:hypothetical protein
MTTSHNNETNNHGEAWHTGYEACVQGERSTDNPYLAGTWDSEQWAAGFAEAEEEIGSSVAE